MKKLYTVTKDRKRFYVCKYGEKFYSIDRITKSFGGMIKVFDNLQALEEWATANGYKRTKRTA